MKRTLALVLALVVAVSAQEELDPVRVQDAIDRGVAWLEQQQLDDGSFAGKHADGHPLGVTALGVLTLAKCSADRNTEAVIKGYERLLGYSLDRTYGVGLLLMTLEALYAPTPEQMQKSRSIYVTQERKNFQKLSPKRDKDKLTGALDWLFDAQNFVWGYGQSDKLTWHDHSNSQYAMLGVGSGFRLGLDADYPRLLKALDHLLDAQEDDGPEVEWFQVPAADFRFRDIHKLEKDLIKLRRKDEPGSETVERIRSFTEAGERVQMRARGFGYFSLNKGQGPGGGPPPGGTEEGQREPDPPPPAGAGMERGPTLSMTTAGLAMLVIAKSVLEGDRLFDKLYGRRVDQAIRDASAWIAENFSVVARHQYYYLYGLERAGVLTGCHYFGEQDWYVQGGNWILDQQNADGSWTDNRGGMAGAAAPETDISTTCFALMFLKRATVPLIPALPKRVATGQ